MKDELVRGLARKRLSAALGVDEPFPWQVALLERFLTDTVPASIDIPTGLGKTAVMAIWLVARAARPSLPRRLVYVVDRRAVVDQATGVAESLQGLVSADEEFKQALGVRDELAISTLRGKHLDNRKWLSDPSAPALVIGTVDMVGSRLMFEGYGVSRKMRPYHAGLLGADSLVVLDEAHLVPPFERLLETLSLGRDAAGRSLRPESEVAGVVPPLRLLSLSATGRARVDSFSLTEADRKNATVKRRLSAVKRASLRQEVGAKELPEALAEAAWALANAGQASIRCAVFCDRRDDAQKVRESLDARCRKARTGQTELLVGGRRAYEREDAARWLEARGFFAGRRAAPEQATFLVATSAGEVGIDLDADHMVSDLVAWERMVQRLGRVNRRGETDATVVVIPASTEDQEKKSRLESVRRILERLPQLEDGSIDTSPGALSGLKVAALTDLALEELIHQASTPAVLHPPLHRATVEAWSMTSLEEHTGRPQVAPWLRGWPADEEDPQTTVVWRDNLPVADDGNLLEAAELQVYRESADPHLAECLETETFRVVDWLDQRIKALNSLEESDGSLQRSDAIAVILDDKRAAQVVRGFDLSNRDKRDELQRRLSGAVLLVDTRVGGLQGGLLDRSSDVAFDVSSVEEGHRPVPFRIRRVTNDADETSQPYSTAGAKQAWRTEARIAVNRVDEQETAWLVVESLVSEPAESEEGRSVGTGRAQPLEEHESWTEECATRIADSLRLPAHYTVMLKVAARLHDEGKRAERWQRAFRAPDGMTYAKTTSRPNLKLLGGYRHELGSLPYAEAHQRLNSLEPSQRDLCLHLIAAHHGFARPLLRTDGAEEPPSQLSDRVREVALRFSRLERIWGPWGLAWWEALLRAADQEASRRNDEIGGSDG